LNRDRETNVGRLGRLHFRKGLYAYVGSAQNSLETRIRRHFKREKRKFWHIDYLLDSPETLIIETYISKANKERECEIAGELSRVGNSIAGFGSSDCKCKSHLVRIDGYDALCNLLQGFHLYGPDS
jgi:Uri superfamily endonuclease